MFHFRYTKYPVNLVVYVIGDKKWVCLCIYACVNCPIFGQFDMKSPILTTSKHKRFSTFINVYTLDYGGPGVQFTAHSKAQFVAQFTGLKLDLQT